MRRARGAGRRAQVFVLAFVALAFFITASPPKLTRAEQKERTAKLGETYRTFLLDVAAIINDVERDAFLQLDTDPQRDLFIDDFWRRRDKAQGTMHDSFRKLFYERLEFVKEHFEHTATDRARIYLLWGPPVEVTKIDCERRMRPVEIWYYPIIPDLPELGRDLYLLFYLPEMRGKEFVLWHPLTDGVEELMRHNKIFDGPSSMPLMAECRDSDVLGSAIKTMSRNAERARRLFVPPAVDPEAVTRVVRSVVIPNPNAPKLQPRVSVSFPAAENGKTDVQFVVEIPRAQLQPLDISNVKTFAIDVTGEVMREERMWERFRYRFDFPFETTGDTFPVVIDRLLRSGPYVARIKIADAKSGAEAIIERDLDVPEAATSARVLNEASKRVEAIRKSLIDDRAVVRIVPLPDDILSGLQRIETIVSGSAVRGVEFWLDGRKVAARHSPPYTLDLDFGSVPQLHRVRAMAVDEHNQAIAGDEIIVNIGTDPFRVRIVSPRVAPRVEGRTRVAVDVKTPIGKTLRSVELFWNEQRISTMHDPPFVQSVDIPSAGQIGYIRALATLDDEASTQSEDVVIVNSPAQMEEVNVHLVELPTTVLSSGRARLGLPQSAFRVLDDGKPATIAKFEEVKNLPLSIGIAVDNSASMESKLAAAQKAAAEFLKTVMRTNDKAFLIAFDASPRVLQTWSSSTNELFAALGKMDTRDQTALYDSIVYSLYNFIGVRGQRALVVVTDGKDTASKFTYEQTIEYARRSGVPVYAIGVGIRTLDAETRVNLARIAAETGGNAYFIGDATSLASTYESIAAELRSQYLIGFYPPATVKPGSKWREVSVEVEGGKAKTIRGYYP